jgi:proteasome lid subunit RPN8/RPN11
MIVNVKISNPRSFRFPNGNADADMHIVKPIEVQKRRIGSIESGIVARAASPMLIDGVYGNRFVLLMDERAKVSRVMMGYSVWSDVFLIPQHISLSSGLVVDADLLMLGTGMIVMTNRNGAFAGDLKIDKSQLLIMTNHAQGIYPEECGGLLLGMLIDGDFEVKKALPMDNIHGDSRRNRIEINPLDYAKAERMALKEGLGVWGFYHSHPNAEAVPSEYDRAHFPFTNWWYPILAVKEDRTIKEVRCWKLSDDRERFDELHVEINEPKARS